MFLEELTKSQCIIINSLYIVKKNTCFPINFHVLCVLTLYRALTLAIKILIVSKYIYINVRVRILHLIYTLIKTSKLYHCFIKPCTIGYI